MTPKAIVEGIYAAFERGDITAILERLAPDVAWDEPAQSVDVAWLAPRRGRDNVGAFFASLSALEFQQFEVKTILEGPGIVIALVDVESVVKSTGRRIVEHDETHIWRFDSAGRVKQFRHRVDTHQHYLAAGARQAAAQ